MTINTEQTFGPFKVREANPKTLVPKQAVVEVRLSETDLILLDEGGQTLGKWPREQVRVEINSDYFGCLRLDKSSVWVNTGDGKPLEVLWVTLNGGSELPGKGWIQRAVETGQRWQEEGLQAQRRQLEASLSAATNAWTLPAVARTYESKPEGEKLFADEAVIFAEHNYQPTMQSAEGSHLHAGRLLLTGGLSIFAGRKGIRSKGKLTVTFQRQEPVEQGAPCWQCRELVIVGALKCRHCGAGLIWPE